MMLIWFVIAFVALLIVLMVLLVALQRRSRDRGPGIDPRDLPGRGGSLGREFDAGVHRGSGSGPVGF